MIHHKIMDDGTPVLISSGVFSVIKEILVINTYGTGRDYLSDIATYIDNGDQKAAYKNLLKKLIEFMKAGRISSYYDSINKIECLKAVYYEDIDEGEHYLLLDKAQAVEALVSTFRNLFAVRNMTLNNYFNDSVYYPLVKDITEYLEQD